MSIKFKALSIKQLVIAYNHIRDFDLDIIFSPECYVYKQLEVFIIVFPLQVTDKNDKFTLSVHAEAAFDIPEDINNDLIKDYLRNEAPLIAVDKLRKYLYDTTKATNLPAYTLPTFDLKKMGIDLANQVVFAKI